MSTRQPDRSTRFPLWAVGLAAVVILGVVAVLASRGSDEPDVPAGFEQTRPVAVEGTPLPRPPEAGADPAVGMALPELQGASFDGEPVAITDDGTPKVLLFLAHWCPHCQREVPVVQEWLDANGPPEGVTLVSVATGTTSDRPNFPPSAWLEDEGWELPVLADDGTAADAVGLGSFPFFVAVDAAGEVVARAAGSIGAEGLEALIGLARTGSPAT